MPSPLPRPAPLLDADQGGYTKTEYDCLLAPLPPSPPSASLSPRNACMSTLLRLSKGVREGRASGFDSGQSLDYVYENCPRVCRPSAG